MDAAVSEPLGDFRHAARLFANDRLGLLGPGLAHVIGDAAAEPFFERVVQMRSAYRKLTA